MPDKLTDKEIVKALEDTLHRIKGAEHLIVPKEGVKNLCNGLQNALDLINRLQAENERLNIRLRKERDQFADIGKMYSEVKAEAYKECIEKAKSEIDRQSHSRSLEASGERFRIHKILDNLSKELVGEDNG